CGLSCFWRLLTASSTHWRSTLLLVATALNLSPALMNAESLTQCRTFCSAHSQTQLSGMSYAQQGWLTKGQHFL
ncbi:hypothetical protein, partial [Pseudomonas syringae group genomosp. 3]